MEFSRRLREAGWLVPAIRSPSVPEGTDRLRISLTLLHDTELLERFSVDLADTARSLSLLD
jgi:8-amino-7-oxononanoate synthase